VLGRSISQALAALPEADREVPCLVAWEGLTDARMFGLAGPAGQAVTAGPERPAHRGEIWAKPDQSGPEMAPNS
jgi:hypothetical protein